MNRYRIIPAAALCALVLPGCAALFSGTSQEISVQTTPSDASCKLVREGATVGEISNTPGTQTISKTKHDLDIECEKAGYLKTTYHNDSGIDSLTYANILGGYFGFIFWAIDSASGADNKYTSPVKISMVPASRTGAQFSLLHRERKSSYPPLSSRASRPGPYASHGVRLGSYENAIVANFGWTRIWSQHWKVLQGVQASIQYSTGSGGTPGYNLYGKGLTKDQAQGLCRNLLARQASCTVVKF